MPFMPWPSGHKHLYKLQKTTTVPGQAPVYEFKCEHCYDVQTKTSYDIWHPRTMRYVTPNNIDELQALSTLEPGQLRKIYDEQMALGKSYVVMYLERRLDGTWTNAPAPTQEQMKAWSS